MDRVCGAVEEDAVRQAAACVSQLGPPSTKVIANRNAKRIKPGTIALRMTRSLRQAADFRMFLSYLAESSGTERLNSELKDLAPQR